jgi:hypothetical protein
VLGSQTQDEGPLPGRCRFDGELGDETLLVLDLSLQIIVAENWRRPFDDICQLFRGESVILIVRHPCLEAERRGPAGRAPTVQECLVDTTHFRDVRMSRNESAIGEEKTELVIRMIAESFKKE